MKKGKLKWSLAAALILFLGMFLAACGGGSEDKQSSGDTKASKNTELADKQELNFVRSSDLPTVDLSMATDTTSSEVIQRTHPGLITFKNNKMVPEMAAEMPEVNEDGTVYTFKLRKDAKWSNGDPLTAKDFVFAWRRLVDPDTASQYAYIMGVANVKNAEKILNDKSPMYGKVEKLGVKAVDKHTLQVTLESPIPYFTSLMAFNKFGPLNEEFVKKQGDKYAKEPENLLTVGPYKLTKWEHGVGWTLEKNKDYYAADEVNITKATFKVVKEKNTQLSLYKSDDIQVNGLSAEQVNAYKEKPDFHNVPGNCMFWWELNAEKVPEFKYKKVRKAMSLVINRKGLTSVLLNNGSIPATHVVPKDFTQGPAGKGFHEGQDEFLTGGVEEAKKLWKEAKKEHGFDKLEITFLSTDGDLAGQAAEFMANQLEQLDGMKVNIKKLPWNAYLEHVNSGSHELDGSSGWCPDYKDPMTFLGYWHSDGPNDANGIEREKYDKLIEKARNLAKQQKEKERWEVLQKAEKVLIENAIAIPTYQKGSAMLVKPYVEGIAFQNFGLDTYFREAKVYKH
ncbi:peptide ABC transporter substrate-binding protein [Virgibacillus siamensis]|uniref:peptide ABC transporter substrate-binding protein n=1 Tax=Virgibacillus siamensis TaxID=480071 RepID=UPI0009852227|nr:peptide ABC transporter substrate-binding protein [Virgibacillus siamensis]